MAKPAQNIILLFSLFIMASCKNSEKYKKELYSHNHPTVIMKAAYKLGERKDTSAIKPLLTNILDPRMSTSLRFKGMTVCYGRLVALGKITGVAPSWEIDRFIPDTAAVDFYLDLAISNGIIRNKDEISIEYSQ